MRITLSIPLTLKQIADFSNGLLNSNPDIIIKTICTNSKEVKKGELFVAIKGEKFNGENLACEAKNCGAYIFSSLDSSDIKVSSSDTALLLLAKEYKKLFSTLKTTIAIIGSVGKTTTKNFLYRLLRKTNKVHATEENYNNTLGLAHTILSLPVDTEILIAELGMNHSGEISLLSKSLSPDISIITNIGTAHIGNLGTRENIAKAKLEILEGMSNQNLIVPYQEPLLSKNNQWHTVGLNSERAKTNIKIIAKTEEYSVFDIKTASFTLKGEKILIPGTNALYAIAFAFAVLNILGFGEKEAKAALSELRRDDLRGNFISFNGFDVFDDTYSSSPEAVASVFEFLSLYKTRKKSCVLGDMLELGEKSYELHKYIGALAYQYGFRAIYAFGNYANAVALGGKEAGFDEKMIFINENTDSPEITAKQILNNYENGEIILIKASHALSAHRITEKLMEYKKNERSKNVR